MVTIEVDCVHNMPKRIAFKAIHFNHTSKIINCLILSTLLVMGMQGDKVLASPILTTTMPHCLYIKQTYIRVSVCVCVRERERERETERQRQRQIEREKQRQTEKGRETKMSRLYMEETLREGQPPGLEP